MVSAADNSAKQAILTPLTLGVLAVAVYAPMIGWGLPYATAPDRIKTFATDEIVPLEALAEMHSTFVVSKPDRNYGYPWWHYFVAAAAQAPYLGYAVLTGELTSPTPDYPYGFQDPVTALQALTLIGRAVSVLMAAGVVVAAYYFSKALWGHAAGVIGALLTLLNYLMIYYSRTGNLDVPALFWTSIGLAIFARILTEGFTVRRAAWLGIFAGLAMATKDQALVVFLPIALVLLAPRLNGSPHSGFPFKPALAGLTASVLAYLVGTGMLVDPNRHIIHVYALLFDHERVTASATYFPPHPRNWGGLSALGRDFAAAMVDMMSWPVLVAAAAGVFIVGRSSPARLVLLLPIVALAVMLFLPTGIVVRRYLLPLTIILDGFAACALVALGRSRWRAAWVPALCVLLGWRILIGADLTYAQIRDTRYPASAWLRENLQSDDRVAHFGDSIKMPHLPAAFHFERVGGREDWHGDVGHGRAILENLANGPEYVVVIPDWTSRPAMERSADCPPEVYEALLRGTVGYRRVAHFSERTFLPAWFQRPPLDNPSVCPPVRIFVREDVWTSQRARLGLNRSAAGTRRL